MARVVEIMVQSLDGAAAVRGRRDQSAGGGYLFFDRGYGIRGTCGHPGVGWIEHFKIVVAIADGETAIGT